jgi:hypothetical protein
MQYLLLHRGIPIATTDVDDPRALSAVLMRPLAAFQGIRLAVPEWNRVGNITAVGAAGFTDALELRDALGAVVPAARLDLWIADDGQLLLFAQFDASSAHVGARFIPPRRAWGNAADSE